MKLGYVLTLVIGMTAGSLVSNNNALARVDKSQLAGEHVADAAYRDGLYMGQLDAKDGHAYHVAIGRWRDANDRSQYRTGYQAGFESKD